MNDCTDARLGVVALNRAGRLDDTAVKRFANRGERTNVITAISVLSGSPIETIERLILARDCSGVIGACCAAHLSWQTTLAVLNNGAVSRLSIQEQQRARELFDRFCRQEEQPGTDRPPRVGCGIGRDDQTGVTRLASR